MLGSPFALRADKLSADERIEITRGLMSEFAHTKITLPRAKKALEFPADGQYDREAWQKSLLENGPAARVGEEIQITRVLIEDKKILLEINGGLKGGRRWFDHVQVGMNGGMAPVNRSSGQATAGSNVALVFPKSVPSVNADEIKTMLAPLFDFSKVTATKTYVENLPEPIKQAIHDQKAVAGMDRDQVLLSMGRPRNKSRETKDGDELEDWIYGEPPGKVVFVTFSEGKVVKVNENYANPGGYTAPPLAEPQQQ